MSGPQPTPAPDEQPRRQAPRWGEYATPEEVAELRGPDAEPIEPPVTALAPPSGTPVPGPPPPGAARRFGGDMLATMVLLGFGAWNVLSTIGGLLDTKAVLTEAGTVLGAKDLDIPGSAQIWGNGLIVLNVVLFIGTFVWSRRRLREGRLAFWVPLAAGVVATSITTIVLISVLAASGGLDIPQNQG